MKLEMNINLTDGQKKVLEKRHRTERDRRIADRIKAVLLTSEGWSQAQISQALRINEETVRKHLSDWISSNKLKPENGGSVSQLDAKQSASLENHLEQKTYLQVSQICAYVLQEYGVQYTVSGMTKWLHKQGFSYKQPKATPAKADAAQQAAFIAKYNELIHKAPAQEPILFMDSAHPTMATKVAYGWIRKGQDKAIAQTASRTRVNVTGAVDLSNMQLTSCLPEYVNAQSTVAFFDQIKSAYPNAPTIHIILDQSGYHKSHSDRDAASQRNIKLHFLPPYSPNLNPIERVWKVMNEKIRNNVFFSSANEFRQTISDFFKNKINQILPSLRGRINDNFQIIKPVS
jgi:transposase